ncbi:MAG: AAA family ATPase [Gemmataceae bacterium]|nr:AAA family ATPase [Gemmataceae bacterium]
MNLEQQNVRLSQWMVLGNGTYQVCGPTRPYLPAGAYTCSLDCYGNPLFSAKQLHVDDLIDFSDSLSARILDEITRFWGLGERFGRYGFLHRRGYLFYGKQGGGKSSLVHQIIARVTAAGNITFFCEQPNVFVTCMERFRRVEPERPMVCVFEDIDALIAAWGDSDLLQWLDGNQQVDRAVNIATTNYPEKLDRRMVSRPRRFDRILRIDAPDERLRGAYFARKMPDQPPAERERWVRLSEGLSFAALAELVISVRCLGNGLEETVALLRDLDGGAPSSNEYLLPSAPQTLLPVPAGAQPVNGVPAAALVGG